MMAAGRGGSAVDWESIARGMMDGSLTEIDVPSGVTYLRRYAFAYNNRLTRVTIPDSVTSSDFGVFDTCTSLTDITLGNGMPTINQMFFDHCTALEVVRFPSVVSKLSWGVFRGCSRINTLIFERTDGVVDNYAADQIPASTQAIYVPDALVNTYKAHTKWSSLASKIFPISDLTT